MPQTFSSPPSSRSLIIICFLFLGFLSGPQLAEAAVRITSITPSCAVAGERMTLTGKGFGALNVTVTVNGLPATVSSATGNRVQFVVPTGVTSGIATVTATNPGEQGGSIALRIKGPEICGNTVDEDCDRQIDDPDVCTVINHSPSANAGPDQTAAVGTTVHLDGTASSDPDGNPLTYQWTLTSKPSTSTATINASTTATPTILLDRAGTYTLQLVVKDGSLTSLADSVILSTSNSAPVAHAGADQTGQVGNSVQLDGSASSDVDGNPLTYEWSVLTAPSASTAVPSDPTSVTPTFTPDKFGTYILQLLVHDGTVSSAPDTTTIDTLNSPPIADAGPDQSAIVGESVTLDGNNSSDADANPLSFQWSLVTKPLASAALLQNPTTSQPTFTIDKAGTYVAQLVVNDGIANSPPDNVTVSTLNSKPIAQAGADQSGQIGTTITLDGSTSSDVDGDLLTYQWSLTSKPAASTATLSDPTGMTPSFTIDKAGIYIGQLVVHDGTVPSEPDTTTVSTRNSKPIANAGPDQSGQVGTTITLDGSGSSDVDGDPLTYVWSLMAKPAGSTATLSDPSVLQPTFVIDKPGTYTAQLIVHDGTVDSEPATTTMSTRNSQPIANAGPDQSGQVGTTITLDGSASSDVEGDALTWQWSLSARPVGSTATLSEPSALQPIFVIDKPGTYTAQLIVHDGMVDSEPATVTISTLNSKPVANAGEDQHGTVGTTITLIGTQSFDVDGDPLTYQWSFTSTPADSTATLSSPSAASTSFVLDRAGTYTVQLIVRDGTLDSDPVTMIVTTLNSKPVADAGTDQTVPVGRPVSLTGSGSHDVDGTPLTYAWSLSAAPTGSAATLLTPTTGNSSFTPDLAGLYVVQLIVHDGTVESDPDTVTITVEAEDTTPPPPADLGKITVSAATSGASTIIGNTGSVEGGAQVKVTNTVTNQNVTVTANADGSFTVQIGAQNGDTLSLLVTDSAGNSSPTSTVTVSALPPDPATIAPPINRTVATDIATTTEFLYSGANPIQTGVAPGTIEARRVAVLRGKVLTREGTPLSGVTVTLLNHPEFGQTVSRADGMFDLAVNGGGSLTLDYQKPGYLPAQRQVTTPWRDYVFAPEVALIPLDPQVTTIDLTDTTPMQVAQGSEVTDSDGTRQATILFPQGTTAQMILPDGSTQLLTTLHVRATEYTVGPNGPTAMPASLPPSSGYTYAVELSADEASAVEAEIVKFNQPVIFYVNNFLSFPIGGLVPVGYYDRGKGVWVPSDNGQVVKVVAVTGDMAELDTDGDGTVDNGISLGVTDTERQEMATVFRVGQSLWRVPITHFTPWDCNWSYGPEDVDSVPSELLPDYSYPGPAGDLGGASSEVPPGIGDPLPSPPLLVTGGGGGPLNDPNCQPGSVIECENHTLGEMVPVVGVPGGLRYQSGRVSGRVDESVLTIPITRDGVTSGLKQVELKIQVGGQRLQKQFAVAPRQTVLFRWDGKDGYGRPMQGKQPVSVQVGYTVNAVYQEPAQLAKTFAQLSGVPLTANRARQEITIWRQWWGQIGTWDAQAQGLGAWTLAMHHAYDPFGQVFYSGEGSKRSTQTPELANVISTVVGTGEAGYSGDGDAATAARINGPGALAMAPDGTLYFTDTYNNRIRAVSPDGVIRTVAGTGVAGAAGDGGSARQAQLNRPHGLALAPDGSLYIADTKNFRIRRVSTGGIMTTVAGTGAFGYGGDGGPATEAILSEPISVAIGADRSMYFIDSDNHTRLNHRLRRVGLDGIMTTVAGTGGPQCGSPDGVPARVTALEFPWGLASGPDGSLYFVESGCARVRRIGPNGIVQTIAGNGGGGYDGDGGLATDAQIGYPWTMAVAPDGSVYIISLYPSVIRVVRPDGIITTFAGTGEDGYSGDGGPARAARIDPGGWPTGITVGPNGAVYLADYYNNRIRQIGSALPQFVLGEYLLPNGEGTEAYVFNTAGRHLRTYDTLTGAVRRQFNYDDAGRLLTVSDANNNVTTIERNATGDVTGIVSPYGQRTIVNLDAAGYLAKLTNPAGEAYDFTSTEGGLLTEMQTPRGQRYRFGHDKLGRLAMDANPAGGSQALERTADATGYTVAVRSAAGRQNSYRVEELPTGDQRRVTTHATGTRTISEKKTTGRTVRTLPDGTGDDLLMGPDPRFGMQAPVLTERTMTTPGGLTSARTSTREVNLADTLDPLSLESQTDTLTVNGRKYTQEFARTSKTVITTSPAGRQTTRILDEQGRIVRHEVAGITPLEFRYDSRGRVSTIQHGARTSTWAYNTDGYLASMTDPLSRVVTFARDAVGRVTTQILPGNRVIQFTYDAQGNMTTLTPPGRPGHDFTYTPVNLLDGYGAPAVSAGGTNITTYAYNLDRQLTTVTRPDGQQVILGYDSAGRLSTQVFPDPRTLTLVTLSSSYDATTSTLSTLTAPGGKILAYSYDGALPTDTTWAGPIAGSVGVTYDNNFRVTAQSVNGDNSIPFTYDLDSLLTGAGALTLGRNAQNGLLTGTDLGSVSDTITYTPFAEPSAYEATAGGGVVFRQQYTRDNLGRITTKTETAQGVTDTYGYTYDVAGRLTEVHLNGATLTTYAYDSNGNRLTKTSPSGITMYTYDAQDRLLTRSVDIGAVSSDTYAYTANGELQSKTVAGLPPVPPVSYSYDVLGNLLGATLADGTQLDYVHDGQNRRVGKKRNGTLVQGFLYQNQLNPVAELNGTGAVVSRFVYASRENVPDYLVKNGATYRIISDHLGSPRLIVNTATGAVMQRLDYDEFGQVITDTNPGFQPFGFAGGVYDRDTKLVRFGARDYDAETGRWTAKDPILFAGGDTNLYGYVLNDPVNLVDPNGLATYQCRRPLATPPGNYADKENLTDHQYTCITLADGTKVCSSTTINGKNPFSSPARPTTSSEDYYHPGACKQVEKDNQCFEECIQGEWNQPRPTYGIGPFGTDCQEYDDAVHSKCRAQCGL